VDASSLALWILLGAAGAAKRLASVHILANGAYRLTDKSGKAGIADQVGQWRSGPTAACMMHVPSSTPRTPETTGSVTDYCIVVLAQRVLSVSNEIPSAGAVTPVRPASIGWPRTTPPRREERLRRSALRHVRRPHQGAYGDAFWLAELGCRELVRATAEQRDQAGPMPREPRALDAELEELPTIEPHAGHRMVDDFLPFGPGFLGSAMQCAGRPRCGDVMLAPEQPNSLRARRPPHPVTEGPQVQEPSTSSASCWMTARWVSSALCRPSTASTSPPITASWARAGRPSYGYLAAADVRAAVSIAVSREVEADTEPCGHM
jgi:hypothetical protein